MPTKVLAYTHQALAASGFAILDSRIAITLRPDLWTSGLEATGGFGLNDTRNRLRGIGGVKRFCARLIGVDGTLTVLARSSDNLAKRIEWVTGFEVREIFEEQEIAGIPAPRDVPRRRPPQSADDQHAGIQTAEGSRTCSSCNAMSAGNSCRNASISGLEYPSANVQRRCLGYTPKWDAYDKRPGSELWPELLKLEAGHGS